ncbi:MAG: helix-turn-helix transcriptional regulator [Clostridia bacterium]|nr:helix-turn-helix transcriptional regulator [Clostridia bacterium]
MSGKRRVNLASIWIIVIFTVIAVTLVAIFVLVYSSIVNREINSTLRGEATVLSDNADYQIMEPIRSEPARRLTAKNGLTDMAQAVCREEKADSLKIQTLSNWCAAVCAAIPSCDRLGLYFPETRMVTGSDGVHFLDDKKYTVNANKYAFLTEIETESTSWLRKAFSENGEDVLYIVYVRPLPGVFPDSKTPMIVSAVKEENLHALLRNSLRTLGEEDSIFLSDIQGVIWSAEDDSLVGTSLPIAEPMSQACRLQNGQDVLLAESTSAVSGFIYVLARPNPGWLRNYSSTFSLWVLLCLALLGAGMIAVLWVLMAHYSRPMRRLMRRFPLPGNTESGGSLVASPSEHFSRIEMALQDMSEMKDQQARFLQQSRAVLRSAWLNCLVAGEAHYTGPMPQLDIAFPYPYFQAVMLSPVPDQETEELILGCFPEGFETAAFTSREKERVYLVNHAQGPDAVPDILRKAGEMLDERGVPLVFGVGVFVDAESRVQVSFRCARRALSGRYFGDSSRVCVFEPKESPKGEEAMSRLISRLYSLTSLIHRQAADEVNEEIDGIVAQLKERTPYLNMMRSVMLTAAMFLCKMVYDMKGKPEEVFGEDLMNTYYHIEDINQFSARLKEDSMTLIAYLSRESSESNRSIVQYAILHIRNAPPAELSIQSIADALSISTGHLSRVFHQETGKKLVDYLLEVRMEHAARLIRENELTNEQICETIGYSRLQYFSAKFREFYGVSLNEYRRRSQSEQEAQADQAPITKRRADA